MNIRDLPPGHYVATRHPDGRHVIVPWDDPLAPFLRCLNKARVDARAAGQAAPGDPAVWAALAAWLEAHEPPGP